jgi:hypothetical protein
VAGTAVTPTRLRAMAGPAVAPFTSVLAVSVTVSAAATTAEMRTSALLYAVRPAMVSGSCVDVKEKGGGGHAVRQRHVGGAREDGGLAQRAARPEQAPERAGGRGRGGQRGVTVAVHAHSGCVVPLNAASVTPVPDAYAALGDQGHTKLAAATAQLVPSAYGCVAADVCAVVQRNSARAEKAPLL